MKLCENYIIDEYGCADTIAQCRNMTFKGEEVSLKWGYQKYVSAFYTDILDTNIENDFSKSKRNVLQFPIIIFFYLLLV